MESRIQDLKRRHSTTRPHAAGGTIAPAPAATASRRLAVALALGLLAHGALSAAVVQVVESTLDGSLASLDGNGTCDLREAVEAANTNAPVGECDHDGSGGIDVIDVAGISAPGAQIVLQDGELGLVDSVEILGLRADRLALDGGDATRIFDIDAPIGTDIEVTIADLTLRNGLATRGGALHADLRNGTMAMPSSASITLRRCTLEANEATDSGGALFVSSFTTVPDSALTNSATLVLESTRVIDNTAVNRGGGVHLFTETTSFNTLLFSFVDSTFDGNRTTGTSIAALGGGGIAFDGTAGGEVIGCTVSNNESATLGGGILNSQSVPSIINSTIADNTAQSGAGVQHSNNGAVVLSHVTITRNVATGAGSIGGLDGVAVVGNSIIAGNSGTADDDCGGPVVAPLPFFGGAPDFYNFIGDNSGCSGFFPEGNPNADGHVVGGAIGGPLDPSFDPAGLADNGGPTQTVALEAGSLALDRIAEAECRVVAINVDQPGFPSSDTPVTTDQRRGAKPFPAGDSCEIGAYERGGVVLSAAAFSLLVDEDGPSAETYDVFLNDQSPAGDVMITLTSDGQCALSPQAFALNAGSRSQTVTVTAVDDPLLEPTPHPCAIQHSAASPGDPDYDGIVIPDLTARVIDDDGPALLTGGAPQVAEGGRTDTYTVQLNAQPVGLVEVDLATDGQCLIVAPAVPFSLDDLTPQVVEVAAVDDLLVEDPVHSCELVHTLTSATDPRFDGLNAPLTVEVLDNDSGAVGVAPLTLELEPTGDVGAYQVTLLTEPSAAVTVSAMPSPSCAVTPTDLVFDPTGGPNPWHLPQTVTVTSQGQHGDVCVIAHAASGSGFDDVAVPDVVVRLRANAIDIPTLSSTGALLLIVSLLIAAMWRLRLAMPR